MNTKRQAICLLFGGMSAEYEISCLSAGTILRSLSQESYEVYPVGMTKKGHWLYCPSATPETVQDGSWIGLSDNIPATLSADRKMRGLILFEKSPVLHPIDCVIPALHGDYGEDGAIQGLLELSGIPFVGSGVTASAVCMDKTITKLLVRELGVAQADWLTMRAEDFDAQPSSEIARVEEKFSYPVFVKPASTGSSVGVNKAKNRDGLQYALEEASRYDKKLLIEEFIDGYEIETAVLGNAEPIVSACGQVLSAREFYSYESKYHDAASKTQIPADIPEKTSEEIRNYAKRIYMGLGCAGLSRVDFFVKRDTGKAVFNEINTLPGFTSISMYPKLFEAAGMPIPKLLDELIRLAHQAHTSKTK